MQAISSREKPARRRWLALIPLLVLLFGLLTWANYVYLTGPHRYDNRDFVSLWAGGKAILMGLDPYDPNVWGPLRIQLGNDWVPDDRAPFPLWTLLFFLPFSAFDLGWSAALWVAFSIFLLGGTLYLLVAHVQPSRLSLPAFFLVALGAATFRGSLLSLFLGQITFLLLFFLTAFVALHQAKRPFAAGFVLALLIFKPNPFILFLPLIGVWLLARRDWRTIAGGAASGLLMLAITWLVLPGWLPEWLNVRGKTDVTFITPTVWGLSFELAGSWWLPLGLLMMTLLAAGLGWWFVTRSDMDVATVTALALAASLFTTPYAWEYEQLLLLLPIGLLYLRLPQRTLATAFWIITIFVLPWALYWVATQRGLITLSGLIPLLVLAIFAWHARQQPRPALPTPAANQS